MNKPQCHIRLFFVACAYAIAASTSSQAGQDEARTAAFIAKLQNSDGGFSLKGGVPSTLGATSNAIRSLKNVGGSIPDVPGSIAFVTACRDAKTGGLRRGPAERPTSRQPPWG